MINIRQKDPTNQVKKVDFSKSLSKSTNIREKLSIYHSYNRAKEVLNTFTESYAGYEKYSYIESNYLIMKEYVEDPLVHTLFSTLVFPGHKINKSFKHKFLGLTLIAQSRFGASRFTHTQIAEIVGGTREEVSRAFKWLKENGYIYNSASRFIYVKGKDEDKLRKVFSDETAQHGVAWSFTIKFQMSWVYDFLKKFDLNLLFIKAGEQDVAILSKDAFHKKLFKGNIKHRKGCKKEVCRLSKYFYKKEAIRATFEEEITKKLTVINKEETGFKNSHSLMDYHRDNDESGTSNSLQRSELVKDHVNVIEINRSGDNVNQSKKKKELTPSQIIDKQIESGRERSRMSGMPTNEEEWIRKCTEKKESIMRELERLGKIPRRE